MEARMDQREVLAEQIISGSVWYGDSVELDIERTIAVSKQNNAATINDAAYRAEFKAGSYKMTEDQFVSLRRAEDGLEPFIPDKPAAQATDVALNPLASGL